MKKKRVLPLLCLIQHMKNRDFIKDRSEDLKNIYIAVFFFCEEF